MRARISAASQDSSVRNGVVDATEACRLTGWNDPVGLDTLAAAYAEWGEFERAVGWQRKAIELLLPFEERLRLYMSGMPSREHPLIAIDRPVAPNLSPQIHEGHSLECVPPVSTG